MDARWFVADFAALDDVRRLADGLLAALPRIDVLANNAGAAVRSTRPTVDGNEPNYQVSALAPFLLTTLLTPVFEASTARVVATSSRSHRGARLTPERVREQLDDPAGLSPHRRYARAKLAALLLHREHARRHPRLEIVDFHPGIISSDFGRYLGTVGALATAVSRPFLTTPQEGARRLVHLAVTRDASAAATTTERARPTPHRWSTTAGSSTPCGATPAAGWPQPSPRTST